jgi:threonine/homoserine/homoserine lactone efflux protein
MMNSISALLLAYAAAATLLVITPGLDTALVLRTAASEGPRRAIGAGFGIVTGCFAWAAMIAGGLGVLLTASTFAYNTLRLLGACYLLYVGFKMLYSPRTSFGSNPTHQRGGRSAFARGALTNLLNPKVGVFYVSFLPQFIPAGISVAPFTLLLGAIHGLLSLLWFLALIAATRPLSEPLRRTTIVRWLDRATGGVFIAFGARLALAHWKKLA